MEKTERYTFLSVPDAGVEECCLFNAELKTPYQQFFKKTKK